MNAGGYNYRMRSDFINTEKGCLTKTKHTLRTKQQKFPRIVCLAFHSKNIIVISASLSVKNIREIELKTLDIPQRLFARTSGDYAKRVGI